MRTKHNVGAHGHEKLGYKKLSSLKSLLFCIGDQGKSRGTLSLCTTKSWSEG